MNIFKHIVKAVFPEKITERQKALISEIMYTEPDFKLISISNEEVLLKLPKSNENEEILLTLKQNYNNKSSTQPFIIHINCIINMEDEIIDVTLNFEETTAPTLIVKKIIEAINIELQQITNKIKLSRTTEETTTEVNITDKQEPEELLKKAVLTACLCRLASNSNNDIVSYCKVFDGFYDLVIEIIETLNNPTTREKMYNKYLYIITDKTIMNIFISYCCSSNSFLFNSDRHEEFEHILIMWGYNDCFIHHIVAEAIHKDIPRCPFPLSISEQQMVLTIYTKKCLDLMYLPNENGFFGTSNLEINYAFLGITVFLCNPNYLKNYREEALEIIANYAVELRMNQKDIKDIFIKQTYKDLKKYKEIINHSSIDTSLARFIEICLKLACLDLENINNIFRKVFHSIGFKEDILSNFLRRKTISLSQLEIEIHNTEKTQEEDYNKNILTLSDFLSWGCYGYEVTLLSEEQKLALLTVLVNFSKLPIFNKIEDKDDLQDEIKRFYKRLQINETYKEDFNSPCLVDSNHAFEVVKQIKKDDPFFVLIGVCDDLLFLANNNFKQSIEFHIFLEGIGFTQSEINNIKNDKLFFRYSSYRQNKYNSEENEVESNIIENNSIIIEQKLSLFALLTYLAESVVVENKKDTVANIVRNFASTIHLFDVDIDNDTFTKATSDKQKCIDVARTISQDNLFKEFEKACISLGEAVENNIFFDYEYSHLLKDIECHH